MTNDPSQSQMIRDAMKAIAERKPGRSKLVYDKNKRTIVAVAEGAQAPQALNITADDADMFATLTISSEWLREKWQELLGGGSLEITFCSWDNGDALTHSELCVQASSETVKGRISLHGEVVEDSTLKICLQCVECASGVDAFLSPDGHIYGARVSSPFDVVFVDVQPQLEVRRSGILETTVLSDKAVLLIGVGTGGAYVAVELAKCGIGQFLLVDRDRLSVGNVVRHPGGISHVGRSKVNVVRDLILEKNPNAVVQVFPEELSFDNKDSIAKLVTAADIVICGTDNRQSKLLVNQLCVENNVTAIYGGAFRRAYGGQILRVRPRRSPCHQCFVAAMPDEASDVEVSSALDANEIAYSDRPVAVEPGLSLDVSPIANMLSKLALIELLADKSSTLNTLQRDYDAPWYLWLNRPEPGTQYAALPPLSESSDEMTINRWYGIYFDRDQACPMCGDFVGSLAAHYGLDPAAIPEIARGD